MTRPLGLFGLSLLSGLLLFLSDYPVRAWPLQTIFLLPFLFALERLCASRREALLAGLLLGLASTLPLLRVLEFPLFMGGPLALYLSLLWMLIGLGIFSLRSWTSPLGPLGAGAIVAIVEWIDFTLVPVWGTAQSFVRVWSAAPFAAQVTSAAGMTGLAFVVVSAQAFLGRILWGAPGHRLARGVGLALLLGVAGAWCGWSWTRPVTREMTLAAAGWTHADLVQRGVAPRGELTRPDQLALFERVYRPLVEEAAARGAELIAAPEVTFMPRVEEAGDLQRRIADLARRLKRRLVVGMFDPVSNTNRALLFDASGSERLSYTKTHLIPFVEKYQAGSGTIVVLGTRGGDQPVTGAMICQDDNFTDLARAYGRAGVQLMLVPTNDWKQVKDFHLESSIFRAIENRYAVLRAASNGVSAIISSRGEVLARRDHFREGAGVIVARAPLRGGPTLYSSAGDWLPAASLLLLVAGGIARRRRPRR